MSSMTLTPATAKPRSAADALTAGIDTHKNTHHVAIVDHLGRPVADRAFNTTIGGYRAIGTFLHDHGHVERVGVEGTGSYGAGIARVLTASGFTVIEVIRHNRQARRLRGKSDPLDAHQAAVSVLTGVDATVPKSAGRHAEGMRILVSERRSAVKARSQAMNQIHALLVTSPDPVRTTYRGLRGANLISTLASSRPPRAALAQPDTVARIALKRLARRHQILTCEITSIDAELDYLTQDVNLNRPRFDAASFRVWKEDRHHAKENPGGHQATCCAVGPRPPR